MCYFGSFLHNITKLAKKNSVKNSPSPVVRLLPVMTEINHSTRQNVRVHNTILNGSSIFKICAGCGEIITLRVQGLIQLFFLLLYCVNWNYHIAGSNGRRRYYKNTDPSP